MSIHGPSGNYEYLKLFNLLISNKHIIGEQEFLSEYVLELQYFFKEAVNKRVENVIIHVSARLFQRRPAFHHWLKNYLLPQLTQSEIKKIAFVLNSIIYSGQEVMISGTTPQIGVFISKSEAIAWLSSLSPHQITREHPYSKNYYSLQKY
ncbi:MAG: hypothetical protein RBR28_01170 [Lentimicrobium sp.]|jgi:hypothetical protein|nr:hypothetical protein [Lentimicrobium sp.]